jgi:hypothetical protein
VGWRVGGLEGERERGIDGPGERVGVWCGGVDEVEGRIGR